MRIKTIKGFTILELLVVIAILGIFTVVAYPNISKWIDDRAVKKDVYDVINYINERKNEIQSGEYGMHQVALNTRVHTYSMTTKNYFNTYKKVGQIIILKTTEFADINNQIHLRILVGFLI